SLTSRDSWATIGSNGGTEPTNLTIRILQDITDNFSEERSLGQGAYGKVYKGVHENGEKIAVKLLHNNMQVIDDKLFKQEFTNLMMLNHENIIRLVGYCYETQHQHMEFQGKIIFGEMIYKALCFEYMHKGSLQKHLYEETQGLDWDKRYKIIKGTCEGLKYLHEGFKEPIYHLDLKPENILLDEYMMPKLADFGLSKLFGEEQTRVTQSPLGTIGYMPHEYLFKGIVSKKVDIFSLGVVMIKIITGPKGHSRSAEMPYEEFLDEVQENWRNRFQATLSSSQPLEGYCQQVNICTKIALSCMETDRHKRPTILDIIDKLNETETMIDEASSWSECMSSWMRGDLVKLEAFTKCEAIPRAKTCSEFPVMLRITGEQWRGVEEMPRAGVDVVVVVEVDWFMVRQGRMDIIKEALMIVIDKLGPNDRLSILSFEDNVPRIMKLTFMSDRGRDALKFMVNELSANHSYNIVAALQVGAEILRDGQAEEAGDSRIGCIMFVSDSSDTRIRKIRNRYNDVITKEFPAYVFGMGEQHHPEVMKYIADMTGGTCSFVDYDLNEMRDAFELFISGLTKIAATSIKITLRAHEGASISSIYSRGFYNRVSSDRRSGEIHVDNMYAGERKNFIAYLSVAGGNKEKLMTAGGRYRSFMAHQKLADTDVLVLRPGSACSPGKNTIHPQVAAELVRIGLWNGLLEIGRSAYELEELWVGIKRSEEGGGAAKETLLELGQDVAEIKREFAVSLPPPYFISWLNCHEWQRATTKGTRRVSGAFTVPGQHEDEDAKVDNRGHD
uniref:Protein kinase domain-containing protein n=2 Tax=Aegilops tauschii subsp. strangulata TaxID=200361 RepID=A0A453AH44_AEGTS